MLNKITDKQLQIIQATGKILTQMGVNGLTIKKIALEMGFSESAIYRHFASKEDVLVIMLEYLANNMEHRFATQLDTTKDAVTQFKDLFENQFLFFKNNPHFVVAVFSEGLLEESQKINNAIGAIINIKTVYLGSVLQKGQQTGLFTNALALEDLVHIIIGAFRLLMFKWRVSKFEFDILTTGNQLIYNLLSIIQPNEK